MTVLCIIPYKQLLSESLCHFTKWMEPLKGGWGSLVRSYNKYAVSPHWQCHEVSGESVHIPFIRAIATRHSKFTHALCPVSQPPTLWSVSCFQILTEVEDINSEGSYGGDEGGREREYLMTYSSSEKYTIIICCKSWPLLHFLQEQERAKIKFTFWAFLFDPFRGP